MPIEFRCTQCNRLLRTGDDTAGKQAKCPECGTVSTIPEASIPEAPPEAADDSMRGYVPPASGSPFAGSAPRPAADFDPENPYASPGHYGPAPAAERPTTGGPIRPTVIDLGDVMTRTWTIFKEQWGMCLLVASVVWLISFVLNMLVSGVVQVIAQNVRDEAFVALCSLGFNLIVGLFNLWLYIGQYAFFLKVARGRRAEFSDVFSGGRWYLPVLVAGFLWVLMYAVGLFLCIVPGVILALMFGQFIWLIIDNRAGIIDSLKLSMEITSGNKASLFVLWLIYVGLSMLGLLACCVGIFPAMAFLALLGAVKYLVMTGQPTADQFMFPAQPAASEEM